MDIFSRNKNERQIRNKRLQKKMPYQDSMTKQNNQNTG